MSTDNGAARTRQRILQAALDLFAEHGTDAVSLRMINAGAGARNASAVHYHFGSKQGVVLAVLERIRARLDDERVRVLDALDRDGDDPPPVRRLISGWLDAYLALERTEGLGPPALAFLGRLVADPSAPIQRALAEDPRGVMKRFDAALGRAVPDLPADLRRSRYLFTWTLIVQMLATAETWGRTPVGDLRGPEGTAGRERLVDFLCGGLVAPASAAEGAPGRTARSS